MAARKYHDSISCKNCRRQVKLFLDHYCKACYELYITGALDYEAELDKGERI